MPLELASSSCIAGNSLIETSQAGLPSLLGQIEAELYSSELYCQVVTQLQTMLGEAATHAQMMVKTLAREAIQLAFMHVTAQYDRATPSAHADTPVAKQPEMPGVLTAFDSLSPANPSVEPDPIQSQTLHSTQIGKPSLVRELTAPTGTPDWKAHLGKLGQELKQVREAHSLSLEELRDRTQVPSHILMALETGRADKLPEPVYVRGFIRRIGNELGLDGDRLAAALPAPDPGKSVVPSWYRSTQSSSGFSLNLLHLYFGYAAVMTGALGALQWFSSQTTAKPSLPPIQNLPAPVSDSKQRLSSVPISTPGVKLYKASGIPQPDIAPPEFLDL